MELPIASFFIIFLMLLKNTKNVLNTTINSRVLMFFLIFVVSINIIFRPYQDGDAYAYALRFIESTNMTIFDMFHSSSDEPLFILLEWISSRISNNIQIFFFISWLMFIIPFYKALNRLFTPWQTLTVLFCYFNFVFFYSYTLTVIRQGIAIAFIMLSLNYYFRNVPSKKVYTFSIIGTLFHWSCLPFSVSVLLLNKFNFRLKTLIFVWFILAVTFITKLNVRLVSPISSLLPKFDIYTSDTTVYSLKTNRLDFLLFSLSWIVISILLYRFIHKDELYLRIIKTYILFNSFFILMGFIAFSDRIASYSWFLIPLLIWYPIFKAKKYRLSLSLLALVSFVIYGWSSGASIHLDFTHLLNN